MGNIPLDLLKRQVVRAEQELVFAKSTGTAKDDFAVLFTGNWHDSIPRNVILHRTLSPLDKVCWQAIRLSINNPQQPGTAPSREELAVMVNASAPTITTARQMLRLSRYMTLCSVVRHKGKFFGEIYLLHDEALSISDTLSLDPTYLDFCLTISKSGNKPSRLRNEAAQVLKDIDNSGGIETKPKSVTESIGERLDLGLKNFGQHEGNGSDDIEVNRRKNLSPVEESPDLVKFNSKNENISEYHQGKNLSPDQNLTDFNQRKNFSLVFQKTFCSSFCSSSINNKVLNTHTHTRALNGDPSLSMTEWAKDTKNTDGYTSENLPRYTDSGDIKPVDKPNWMLNNSEIDDIGSIGPRDSIQEDKFKPLETQSPTKKIASYKSIDPHEWRSSSELEGYLNRLLPEIASPVLAKYTSIGFITIQFQIPHIAAMLKDMSPIERRDILLQYLARKASYIHGWNHEDVRNPVGFIMILMNRMKTGAFIPDSLCAEFIRAIEDQVPPVISDTEAVKAKSFDFDNKLVKPMHYVENQTDLEIN